MGVNNFKKLEELEMKNVSMRSEVVKQRIGSNLGSLRFMTNIVELYFPMLVDLFIGLTGGGPGQADQGQNKRNSRYPDMG